MLETYAPDQVKKVEAFSNAVVATQMFEQMLTDSRVDVLTAFWDWSPTEQAQVLLDRCYIADLKKIGFWLYNSLINDGLQAEASDILEERGIEQRVNFDRLMEIDHEYSL